MLKTWKLNQKYCSCQTESGLFNKVCPGLSYDIRMSIEIEKPQMTLLRHAARFYRRPLSGALTKLIALVIAGWSLKVTFR